MPVMPVPRHLPCSAGEMYGWMRSKILPHPWAGFRISAMSTAHPGLEGDHLTRVPFLKVCVTGRMEVVTAAGFEPIEPLSGVVFTPQSFVCIRFVTPCEFLRITFEHDGLLIGRERVGNSIKQGGRDTPAGELEALWVPGVLEQPASGLLDSMLNGGACPPRLAALAQALCWKISDLLSEEQAEPSRPEPRARVILRYLKDQCHRPIDRQSAADALGISPGYLGMLIKQETGKPFQTVLRQMRLEHARWLLAHSSLGVEEIAVRSGFSSSSYFSQVFRNAHGISPRQWRTQ